VENKFDYGVLFRIFLLYLQYKVSGRQDKVVQALNIKRGGTVLLIEDSDLLRNMAKDMLNRLGFLVI